MKVSSFYQLGKEERAALVLQMRQTIHRELAENSKTQIIAFCSDVDTYIRKNAYIALGRIFFAHPHLQLPILKFLDE